MQVIYLGLLLSTVAVVSAVWPPAKCKKTFDDGSAHCFIESCKASRGPTECQSGWCTCKEDYCIADSICQWAGSGAVRGPWSVEHQTFTSDSMDVTDHRIEVYFPTPNEETKSFPQSFPLIGWAHGFTDGDSEVDDEYATMIHALVSFGFVVVAPTSCNIGYLSPPTGNLPDDPPGYKYYYKQLLKTLTWARNQSAAGADHFQNIDYSNGVGVAGHSMGGQAALLATQYAEQYNISATVLQHAFTHTFPKLPDVPILVLTGTTDLVAVPSMATKIFDGSASDSKVRGLVNKKLQGHTEPSTCCGEFNPHAAQFTAAWFKVYLQKTSVMFGFNFEEMLFGHGSSSLCGGGDGAVANCTLIRPAAAPKPEKEATDVTYV